MNKVYRETGILRLVHLKTSFTDFGRACRYNNADNKDSLPVILLSSAAKKRCQTDQMTRRGQFKTSGFHKMKPDYDNKMIEDPDTKKKRKVKSKSKASRNDENDDEIDTKGKPKNDYDLETYSRGWIAGSDHYDKKNTKKSRNRYLLYGRPQLGKTGVYLQIGYLIWKKLNKPMHTSPRFQNVPVVPLEISSENEEDISVSAPAKVINPEFLGPYPLKRYISSFKLAKPGASKRYGDPNNPDVLEHYKSGAQYPHESVNTKNNEITRRNKNNKNHTKIYQKETS